MFVISLIIVLVFFVGVFFFIIVIRLFGLFVGIFILINYLLMIIYFLVVVVLYEKWVLKYVDGYLSLEGVLVELSDFEKIDLV